MKFDYEILKNEYMSISASALLRVIQNDNMPILDLLVREIIQNSLDACLEDSKCVDININTGKFDTYQLNSKFGDVGTRIYKKYEKEINENRINSFIAFSDKNTTGLTGPINKEEIENNQYGKFMNLVFNIGKAQAIEGSGGSWGYGKTVYYRVGIGLVGFYTRIKEGNEYKSRLILALVENENDGTIISTLDTNKVKTGIMWFGRNRENGLYPIVDENEINEFLNIFNLKPYKDDETGTTIIIPYIDEETLLLKTFYNNKNEDYKRPVWCEKIDDYINVSIQRWYAPRLMNSYYDKGAYLRVAINNNLMKYNEFLPVFRIIQRLYNYPKENVLDTDEIKIYSEDINLRDTFESKGITGKIVYSMLNKEELGMPIESEPYKQISNNNDFGQNVSNPPIITFCRKPGMLLKYDIGENWSNKIINNSKENYIIGIFIPNSNKEYIVKEKHGKNYVFEEYLRESEKADHGNWLDLPDYNIIKKIQLNIQNKINNTFVQKEENIIINGISTKLNKKLTSLFLPAIGFGKKANVRKRNIATRKNEDTIKITKNHTTIEFLNQTFKRNKIDNIISEDFVINIAKNDLNVQYEIFINGEDNNISGKEWEQTISKKSFPVEILKLELLTKEDGSNIEYVKRGILNKFVEEINDNMIHIAKVYTTKKTWVGWNIKFNSKMEKSVIKCRLTYKYCDNKYLCNVIRTKEGI